MTWETWRGAAKSVWSTLGILSANAVYFALSATGIGALLLAPYQIFFAVKWIGAAYLIYLGITTFFADPEPGAGDILQDRRDLRLYTDGLALQMANPKAILFS